VPAGCLTTRFAGRPAASEVGGDQQQGGAARFVNISFIKSNLTELFHPSIAFNEIKFQNSHK
jgi:hypothetical protein